MALKRDLRLQITMTRPEIEAVDDFRFEHRLPNRSAAVRELIRVALASQKKKRAVKRNLRKK
jgi:metal-responsive CopG/Arc/MetJ family transcriptional regulator